MQDRTMEKEAVDRWALNPAEQRAFEDFDRLPDSTKVTIKVIAKVEGITPVTVWRRAAAGLLPKGQRVGRTTRWIVGEYRAARRGV
jgi:predicted DNA-binding transcriptional regulator AlpA